MKLPITSPYTQKDQLKADHATKFIGRGSLASSTNKYRLSYGNLANSGEYVSNDLIFVSVEGNRSNRIPLDKDEILLAIQAKASFLSDNPYHRIRTYNVGERELADFLLINNYKETPLENFSLWEPEDNCFNYSDSVMLDSLADVYVLPIGSTQAQLATRIIPELKELLPLESSVALIELPQGNFLTFPTTSDLELFSVVLKEIVDIADSNPHWTKIAIPVHPCGLSWGVELYPLLDKYLDSRFTVYVS